MKDYPNLLTSDVSDIVNLLQYITKERKNEVNDFTNLNQVFISGRASARIPTGANNVLPTDRIGDIAYDYSSGYSYRLILNNTGAAVWSRTVIQTSW